MSQSIRAQGRRKLLAAGGAGLVGIASLVTARLTRARNGGARQEEAAKLAGRIDLPKGTDPMMQAFARDPDKVNRFRELTRWRRMRDQELREV